MGGFSAATIKEVHQLIQIRFGFEPETDARLRTIMNETAADAPRLKRFIGRVSPMSYAGPCADNPGVSGPNGWAGHRRRMGNRKTIPSVYCIISTHPARMSRICRISDSSLRPLHRGLSDTSDGSPL